MSIYTGVVFTSVVWCSLLILSLSCRASDSSICERFNATLNSDAWSAGRRKRRRKSAQCVVRLERERFKSVNN